MSSNKKAYEKRLLNRRQFLVGSGSMLMLPPLLSLMPEKVMAQVMANPRRRALTWIGKYGIDSDMIFPVNQSALTPHPGAVNANYKLLNSFTGDISRMIDSDFVSMYPYMNLMQGLSLTSGLWSGHNRDLQAGTHGGDDPRPFGKTIDVIMEQSSSVYKPGEVVPHKAIRLFTGDHDNVMSYDRVNGNIVTSDGVQGDKKLFNQVFANFSGGGGSQTGPTDDKLIVDKVYADLKALETNARLSSEDKVVLDRYVTGVYELQLKVNAASPSGPACQKPTMAFQATKEGSYYFFPTEGWGITNAGLMFDNYIEIIRLAFACDLTRVVNIANLIWSDAGGIDDSGGIHHEAPSSATAADRQKYGLKKFLKLAKALQATPDPFGGGTLLDNSIMLYTNELGDWTTGHNIFNMPVVTMGSGGGTLRTGYFIDYRQKPLREFKGYYLGRPYKQLLQAIMSSMGVTKTEYSQFGDGKGFGEFVPGINQFGNVLATAYTPYANEHNDPLPFFWKG